MMTGVVNKVTVKAKTKDSSHIAALKQLLSYYQEITDTIREPFIILDKHLCVIAANDAFYRKFKVLKKDTENKLIYELGNNQWDAPELRNLLENILPLHLKLNDFEVSHDFPGLGKRIMLLNARQVDSRQLILLAINDVTRKRQLKKDSAELTAGIIKQRNDLQGLSNSKDEFIAMASHQLRTPATAVKQYIGMLAEGFAGKLSKIQNEMVESAYQSNERQLEIIEDLLRVARIDEGRVYLVRSTYSMSEQLQDVIKEQHTTFKNRKQNVIFKKPQQDIKTYADKKLMRMVLENLLDNASKYSYSDTIITVTLNQDSKHTIIAIKDMGVGIRKVDQSLLFQRFSRIDNPLSISVIGTGLGLYWVKKVMNLHEGDVYVDSKANSGSIFTLKLPITDSGIAVPRDITLAVALA